ncbi:response regulator [Paenibacillus qinlingensis]|uniref:Two-component system response regulator YesN n=1 Tax=Paenibacillus qinlingensis TaxID=1837343 RepID=A0ABU1NTS2_9BACL|nr:response regulator [Paenibacillus qinlingensis]MDR6550835.1 two-component system response regulator YesN [Paenibacillus qinlingensis]
MKTTFDLIIVDDEPIIRKGLLKLVDASNRSIESIRLADSGQEALRMIAEQMPDFLLTDIRMADMDGLELCRTIQEREYPIQVAVISGFGEFQYAQKCLSYGVKEYLLKPINQTELERVLDKLIESRRGDSAKPVFSIRTCESLTERIAEGIWFLEEENLELALKEWHHYLQHLQLSSDQVQQLLQDCLQMIHKFLAAKDVYVFNTVEALTLLADKEEEASFLQFNTLIRKMFSDLHYKRKGKLIDPIAAAKSYIDAHLTEEVSLEEVAKHLGLNASYFSQLFKQVTQETFVHYRMKKRMEKAISLLEIPHYRMSDIAEEVGYIDYSHFAKSFKKLYQLSPSEYRAKLGID